MALSRHGHEPANVAASTVCQFDIVRGDLTRKGKQFANCNLDGRHFTTWQGGGHGAEEMGHIPPILRTRVQKLFGVTSS